MRRLLVIALIFTLACGGKKDRSGTGTGTGSGSGSGSESGGAAPAELARCVSTLERAATLPSFERGGAIVRGCNMCGRPWEAILTADRADTGALVDLEGVWAIVEACGATCSNQSAGAFRNQLTELAAGKPATKPWRALAEACPKLMHADRSSERFVSGGWYALAMIADKLHVARATLPPSDQTRLDAAMAALLLPLPPLTAPGTSFIVPGGGLRPGTPWKVITVSQDAVFVGRLAFAHVSTNGLQLVDGGAPYPGLRVATLAELPAAIAGLTASGAPPAPTFADRIDEPVIVAPRAAPARRVVEVMGALGNDRAFLAVGAPAPAALWRGLVAAHPLALAATAPPGHRLRVGLSTPRIAVVDASGKVLASSPLPVPDRPIVERWTAALNAVAQGRAVEIVVEDGHVEALSQLLDAAAGAAAAVAIPAPAKANLTGTGTGKDLAEFSDVKLKAALDAP
ncbi:MAG TPA: hypothetical protein VM261_22205 [Kofleriaceae bacterium]|nr:hypothetical protein [Kofleriaceae bacterium]